MRRVQFVQARSQGGNPFWHDEVRVEFLIAATLRSLENCEMLSIPHIVVHPGHDDITKEE